jgi:hypothetical protein
MLLGALKHWHQDDSEIVELIDKLPKINREAICKK